MRIKIKTGEIELKAELNNSGTARKIYDRLPINGKISRWGEEVYFEIPLHVEIEEGFAKEVVEKGELGFWPSGDCFCVFFGKTPASKGNEIRPASSVNVFGKVIGDASVLKNTKDGEGILVEKG